MTELTLDQRKLLEESGGQPVRLIDPDTRKQYVLVPAELYDRLRSKQADLDPRDLYPALHRVLRDEGWEEPHMDEYNRYG
jgi:hypothetical protein